MRSKPHIAVSRAQSTVLGTIMLVAVVVLGLTVAGLFTVASITDAADEPVVDLSATVTATELALVHESGDGLETTALAVHVRHDGTEAVHAFADGTLAGDGDDRFEPGERWTVAHGLALDEGDRVRVLVVHDERSIVLDATRAVEG
jgi:FlaG/FlaF family flagellin (archaellin)